MGPVCGVPCSGHQASSTLGNSTHLSEDLLTPVVPEASRTRVILPAHLSQRSVFVLSLGLE